MADKKFLAAIDMVSKAIHNLLDPVSAQDAATKAYVDARLPPGVCLMYGGRSAPAGYLKNDGTAVSRATYSDLFAILCPTIGTVTVTIASPGVFTLVAHNFQVGDTFYITTTGALPTGLSANTQYWVATVPSNDTFTLATSFANAVAGTRINTSGSQSGTHTLHGAGFGIGDASTTFNLPDPRGGFLLAVGATARESLGHGDGQATHHHSLGAGYAAITIVNGAVRTRRKSVNDTPNIQFTATGGTVATDSSGLIANMGAQLGGTTDESVEDSDYPPFTAMNSIIKT